jgi:hypothetical protein
MDDKLLELREMCISDIWTFAKAINPNYMYGDIHERLLKWFAEGETSCKLALLPRGHLKSHCLAVYVVWVITRQPWCSILYISANSDLAEVQVSAIKGMLESDNYRLLFPEMISERVNDRSKWTSAGIIVDHPERKARGIRDWTIRFKTVKSNSTGLHCSHLMYDDVVTKEFAYTASGRKELSTAMGQFYSIKNTDAPIRAVGTRYHPKDAYHDFIEAEYQVWSDDHELLGYKDLWEVFEEKVEDRGDMTGNYLWPRTRDPKIKESFGFDIQQLSLIRAGYESNHELSQFFAQYYNDTNDVGSHRVSEDDFKYYETSFLKSNRGTWYFKDRKLNVFAGMDVAWSVLGKSDYTAIVVIGVDHDGFIYLLDLARFKTTNFDEYYDKVEKLYDYWHFKKLRVETNSGGKLVKIELENRIRQEGKLLSIDGHHANRNEGTKFERHAAILEPRYKQGTILHFKGGLIKTLEEEVMLERPPHDDLADALCSAIQIMKIPFKLSRGDKEGKKIINASNRFGGRRRSR